MKKYKCNENYFSELLDEYRVYWIGFIMADGCIYKNSLQFNLHWKDRTHLEKFKKDIQAKNPIYHIRNACRLMISSKKICDDLSKFNIVPRKSLIAKTPTNIPNNLIKHFWRGMIDGDGHLCIKVGKLPRYSYLLLGLTGTKDIIENFIKFTKVKRKPVIHGNVFTCSLGGFETLRITRLLYKKAKIYLDRKSQYYQKHKHTFHLVT